MKTLPKNIKTLLAIGLLILLGLPMSGLFASHFAGLDYEFECINNCTTRVHFRAYRDCGGVSTISPVGTAFNVFDTACALPTPVQPGWSGPTVVEVTPICPGFQTNCANASSFITGYEELHYWRDYNICNLGTGCGEYYITFNTCCRPATITGGGFNQAIQMDSNSVRINFGLGSCNNSPDMTTTPLFYVCLGDTTVHNVNAVDPDGDSLSYAIGPCYQQINTSITYPAGYSALQPLGPGWNVSLDPASGDITFTPQPGNIVSGPMCITVFEWRNGNLIGRISRDFLVTTMNCPGNGPPPYTFIDIDNEVNSLEDNNWNVYAIPGDTIYFDINTNTAGNSADFYTNGLPAGAQLLDAGTGLPDDTLTDIDPVGRICWPTPSSPGTYSFTATMPSSCGSSQVDQNITIILVDSTDLVWPGDANNNNVANMQDLLAVGMGFGSSGFARASVSNAWQGMLSIPWNDTIAGGLDKKYTDCNGNGSVGISDTVAISQNFGMTHNKGNVYNKAQGAPGLWVDFPLDSAMVGDTVEAKIYLGDMANPAADVYGIVFSFMYDKTLIDSATVHVSYGSSWMGSSANSIGMYKDFFTNGQLEIGFTRRDQQNVTGNGEIATIGLILTDNIDGKREIITETLQSMLMNVLLVGKDGENLPLGIVEGDSLVVFEIDNTVPGPKPNLDIQVYPNPASGQVFVQSQVERVREIEIVNVLGQTVSHLQMDAIGKIPLDIRTLGNGLYYLKIHTDTAEVVKRIVIRN